VFALAACAAIALGIGFLVLDQAFPDSWEEYVVLLGATLMVPAPIIFVALAIIAEVLGLD
jgi:hypothetical protein